MPHKKSAHTDHREQIVHPLLHFLCNLSDRLSRAAEDNSLPSELQSHLTTVRVSTSAIAAHANREDLDFKATELWNLVTRLSRQEQDVPAIHGNQRRDDISGKTKHRRQTFALVRVFAFMLLDCANHGRRDGAQTRLKEDVRLLRVALKAAKSSLDALQFDWCTKVMERAADYEKAICTKVGEGSLENEDEIGAEEAEVYEKLRTEYWTLRMALAWKQNRLDLAESLFRNFTAAMHGKATEHPRFKLDIGEILADLLFEIGRELFRQKDYHQAVMWLDRSLDMLSVHDLDEMGPDSIELRLSSMIYQGLSIQTYLAPTNTDRGTVRALLGQKTAAGLTKAANLISLLDSDHGEKMFVSLLKLDLLTAQPAFDSEQYYTVLGRMMRTVHMTRANFKMILSHIHKLKEHSAENACKALDDFLMLRLFASSNVDWIEKVFITRLWISADQIGDNAGVLEKLQRIVAGLSANLPKPLTPSATHASQVLIWKRINSEYDQGRYDLAQGWAELSYNKVFSNSSEINSARISRKLILCALAKQDLTGARSICNQMSEATRAAPMTRYLMYKIALRDGDAELAAECLDIISRTTTKDASLLYACVLEAQQSGNRHQAIAALQRVLTKFGYSAPSGVHLPALLRCTTRLLIQELPIDRAPGTEVSNQICDLFQGALRAAKQTSQKQGTTGTFNVMEFRWFARTSYNIAVKYYGEWEHEHSVQLMEVCLTFLGKCETDDAANMHESLVPQSRICHVLLVQSLVKLARATDDQEAQLQYYLRIRNHVKVYFTQHIPHSEEANHAKDTIEMSRRMIKNDFEAAVHLKLWDDLAHIVRQSRTIANQQLYEVLADMTLASEAPPMIVLSTLETLITASTTLQRPTTSTLARWLRMGYSLSLLASSESSFSKPDSIISHALALARSSFTATGADTTIGKSNPQTNGYPAEELEYLASTTFNRAIDAYCAGDEEQCRSLGERAVEIADVLGAVDGGLLRKCLVDRLAGLRWER